MRYFELPGFERIFNHLGVKVADGSGGELLHENGSDDRADDSYCAGLVPPGAEIEGLVPRTYLSYQSNQR